MIQLKHCQIEFLPEGRAITHFPDGTKFGAYPHVTNHYFVIAHRLGYGDEINRYCQEHELAHAIAAEWFRDKPSHVIWHLAHGTMMDHGEMIFEEMAAHTIQRWIRANERPILAGVDWDALKAYSFKLLGHFAKNHSP